MTFFLKEHCTTNVLGSNSLHHPEQQSFQQQDPRQGRRSAGACSFFFQGTQSLTEAMDWGNFLIYYTLMFSNEHVCLNGTQKEEDAPADCFALSCLSTGLV